MPNILFPPIETENPSEQTIEFDVSIDGSIMKCAITYDALNDHFEAEYSDPLFAFMSARPDIEHLVTKRISDNLYTIDKGILLTSSDISGTTN